MNKFESLNRSNSTIIIGAFGEEYRTTQTPFLSDNGDHYIAHAVDAQDKEHIITWDIDHPDFENLEDQSEACDWNKPKSIEAL